MENLAFLEVQEFGASLDWLTLTAPKLKQDAAAFHAFAVEHMKQEREITGEREKHRIRNYAGIKCGKTALVCREVDDHEMLVAEGEVANRLAEEVIRHGITAKCTRIDLQVTARAGTADFTYPERLREHLLRAREEEGKLRRKKVTLFDSHLGNSGCTIGSRSSTRYVRIYDWDAKHGEGARGELWRHEAEFKDDAARACFEGYRNQPDRRAFAAGVVKRTLNSMRVQTPWMDDLDAVSVVVGRKQTTAEKRLKYLDTVVFPMMAELLKNGNQQEVLALMEKYRIMEMLAR